MSMMRIAEGYRVSSTEIVRKAFLTTWLSDVRGETQCWQTMMTVVNASTCGYYGLKLYWDFTSFALSDEVDKYDFRVDNKAKLSSTMLVLVRMSKNNFGPTLCLWQSIIHYSHLCWSNCRNVEGTWSPIKRLPSPSFFYTRAPQNWISDQALTNHRDRLRSIVDLRFWGVATGAHRILRVSLFIVKTWSIIESPSDTSWSFCVQNF